MFAMGPNFFLVGTTKGGTSSLHLWLRGHPDVATPPRKEMHYFCHCPSSNLKVADTLAHYLASFPPAKAVGESSPCYLYYPDIPHQLAAFHDSRIVVSLRDPVERFWSHYLMNEIYRPRHMTAQQVLEDNLTKGRTNAIEDLYGMGLYGEQLKRYFDVFPTKRMMVLFLEETSNNPTTAMYKLQDFLGLTPLNLDTSAKDKQHVEPRNQVGQILLRQPTARRLGSKLLTAPMRRFLKTRVLGTVDAKPHLPANLRDRLQDLYRKDSRHLETVLDRSLPWNWHH